MDNKSPLMWKEMHENSELRKNLPPHVLKSWERSISYGVDYMHASPRPLLSTALDAIKKESKDLFVYSNSILKPFFKESGNEKLGVFLFYSDGTLLNIYGGNAFVLWAKNRGFTAGTNWSEQYIGTNAFSLGIMNEGSLKVAGSENFSRFLADLTFYFTPIQLETGKPFGGIAIVHTDGQANELLFALSISIARSIELQLFWFRQIGLYDHITEGTGAIAIDQSNGLNHVLAISGDVLKILGLPHSNYYYEELEKLIDPLPANEDFWQIVNRNMKKQDHYLELRVNNTPIPVTISTFPYKEKKFHIHGTSVSFNSMGRISRLISSHAGNVARYNFKDIIGESESLLEVIKRSRAASHTDSSIILLGESGVGKDVIAQAIHNSSNRSRYPFVALNCASFSKELIASELFGYESGAFTGAKKAGSIGKFELADKGTLLLDEIGDMPLDLQVLLLRVLEEKSFMKVGGNTIINVNVRIIAATNQNLRERIKMRLFREDLFYRLGIIRFIVPPLRERGQDILLLARYFIAQICSRLGKPAIRLSESVEKFFLQYSWPGNVRELRNLLEGIISTCDDETIEEKDVFFYLGEYQHFQDISAEDDERAQFLNALKLSRNNKTKAAAKLNMSRSTFYRRLKELEIDRSQRKLL
jgi:transcriptional regulator with PAS, ATPase and Fis domain